MVHYDGYFATNIEGTIMLASKFTNLKWAKKSSNEFILSKIIFHILSFSDKNTYWWSLRRITRKNNRFSDNHRQYCMDIYIHYGVVRWMWKTGCVLWGGWTQSFGRENQIHSRLTTTKTLSKISE